MHSHHLETAQFLDSPAPFMIHWIQGRLTILVWKWKSLSHVQLFVTPMDSTVHGILQARILKWVAFPFSRGSSQPRDLPNPGIEPRSPALQADSLPAEPQGNPEYRGEYTKPLAPITQLQQLLTLCPSSFCPCAPRPHLPTPLILQEYFLKQTLLLENF